MINFLFFKEIIDIRKNIIKILMEEFVRYYLFILLIIFIFSGCNNKKNEITIIIDSPPSTLEPHAVRELPVISILSNIYEPIVGFDANMKITGVLAEYWEKKDSLTWVFTLRKNVYFHNGKLLKPEDVIYSLKRPLKIPNSEINIYKDRVDTIYKINENKIVIKTKYPYSTLLFDISIVFIIPEGYDPMENTPCGTGPYRFEKMDDKELILIRNNKYWNKRPDVSRAKYLYIRDSNEKLRLLKEGIADIVSYVPLSQVDEFSKYGKVVTTPGIGIRFLEFNLKKYPFSKKDFRYALNIGINRERLCSTVYNGFATPANQFFTPGVFGFDFSIEPIKFDPEEAKKIISKINNIPELTFDYSYARAPIAEGIIEDLENIGLKIKKNPLPSDKYWEKVEKRESYLYIIARIPTSYDGISIISNSFHTYEPEKGYGTQNNIGYSNKYADSIMEELSRTTDENLILERLQYVQRLILEDIPKIPIVWEKDVFVLSKRIKWTPRLDKTLMLKEIKVIK